MAQRHLTRPLWRFSYKSYPFQPLYITPLHCLRSYCLPQHSASRKISSLPQVPSTPRTFPESGVDKIDSFEKIEEERIPNYNPERFYPACLGEVLNDRYQIVGKLGYGATSTVWFCRDLLEPRYVVLKIYILSSRAGREITVYKHLDSIGSDHAGKRCLRMLLDSFEVSGPHGSHICLVHKPLGLSLQEFRSLVPEGVFNMQLLQPTLRQIFAALDYLHTYEEAEFEEPVPRKITNDRTIYTSRPLPITFGVPVLCDLGEARFGNEDNNEDIMPDVYRAPEVILNMNWGYKVDIWNTAMVAWDLSEHNRIFSARNPDGKLDDAYHLAEMIAVLGPPPLEFLRRSEKSLKFWDENGNWRGLAPIPENRSLEELEQRLEGEDKRRFLQYLRRMLC